MSIIVGDALRLPLRDNTVDLIVTSPPYFGLRAYAIPCRVCEVVIADGLDPRTAFEPSWEDHVAKFHREIGSEAHWRDWLTALIQATAEMARVLKPEGSIFVNLGDKYAHAGGQAKNPSPAQLYGSWGTGGKAVNNERVAKTWGLPSKSLMLLPERYRIACVDQLGLTCRAVIIWDKPNGLPESVRDRVRRSHEDWVHLTLGPRYYAALDEPVTPGTKLSPM